jgi:two-component system, sensor histidine kinase
LNILIAEDDLASRELLREMLELWGHHVIECVNGEEALAQLQQYEVELIILDIQMPVLDGLGAIGRIRESRLAPIPAIALTAFAMAGDREKMMAAGFDAHLAKPVDFHQLKLLVDGVAEGSRQIPDASCPKSR